ncbi:MAG TPA: hypothetical protein VKQ72_20655 [Aggregatilineales bacterium]|nr:hypothetical protein [Aggregatilineales bacterium]
MLYQTLSDVEILFPTRVIPSLRDLRGPGWQALIDRLTRLPENDPDVLAFSLMMIRLSACMTCNSDSYRALRGCTHCSQHTVSRFKGSDDDLIRRWHLARADVLAYLNAGRAIQD